MQYLKMLKKVNKSLLDLPRDIAAFHKMSS